MRGQLEQKLVGQVETLLASSLGGLPRAGIFGIEGQAGGAQSRAPIYRGTRTTLGYALLICGGIVLVSGNRPEPHLFWLSVWGAVYLGWAVFSSHWTTNRVVELLRRDILPALSIDTIEGISGTLARRFPVGRVAAIGWCVALAGLAIGSAALWNDIGTTGHGYPRIGGQLLLWAAGWLIVFLTAARSTYVAQFYAVFSEQLMVERERIFPLDPSASGLVKDVSALGKLVFAFWIGISFSIATLLLFFVPAGPWAQWSPVALPRWNGTPLFILLVMPISLSFSLVFATLVFVRSEGAIRRATARVTRIAQAAIQREAMDLLALGDRIGEERAARLKLLLERHEFVGRSGSYKGLFLQLLSLIPLVSSIALTVKTIVDLAKVVPK